MNHKSNSKYARLITKELTRVYPEIVTEINNRLATLAGLYNKENFDEIFLGNDQETQDCTKVFQGVASAAIETVCENNNIPLVLKEVDGADWVFELPGIDISLEQKIRSFLGRSKKFNNNLKRYGLPCMSWTGNKHSVYNGKKTDLHLLWSFEIIGNTIGRGGAVICSLKESGSYWKTGSGNKDSYATLTMNNSNGVGINEIHGNSHYTNKSTYLLLEN
tara:strand:+ start:2699 stop:3355 length:657 start_codon:yes stop_codon:yes gene_type:complete